MAALAVYRTGLDAFPGCVALLTGMARAHEAVGQMDTSAKCYKDVLKEDAINVESIACIAMNHFYSDQPELSLRFYRRLLQMGISNAELLNNLGLYLIICSYSLNLFKIISYTFLLRSLLLLRAAVRHGAGLHGTRVGNCQR